VNTWLSATVQIRSTFSINAPSAATARPGSLTGSASIVKPWRGATWRADSTIAPVSSG
jgi:hypothetical protein